jgi:hypothetical protein
MNLKTNLLKQKQKIDTALSMIAEAEGLMARAEALMVAEAALPRAAAQEKKVLDPDKVMKRRFTQWKISLPLEKTYRNSQAMFFRQVLRSEICRQKGWLEYRAAKLQRRNIAALTLVELKSAAVALDLNVAAIQEFAGEARHWAMGQDRII